MVGVRARSVVNQRLQLSVMEAEGLHELTSGDQTFAPAVLHQPAGDRGTLEELKLFRLAEEALEERLTLLHSHDGRTPVNGLEETVRENRGSLKRRRGLEYSTVGLGRP